MTIDYEGDSPAISQDDLSNITKLASDVVVNEKEVAKIEESLKQAKAKLRQVQERDLPEAMLACNMETFVTTDGLKVSVKETLYATVAAKNKPAAAKWLIENELGALVKEDVVVSFDGGKHEGVKELLSLLENAGVTNFTTAESMNTASIKSAIKELLGEGVEVPLELFGAYFARKAVVK
jgi:hypothetical protein